MARFSATSVLDVSSLERYYGRLDVYVAFTDDGEFDLSGEVDGNIRPNGIYAYMVNDVVGKRSRESTLYGRVFRYDEDTSKILETQKYGIDDYEQDYQKLLKKYSSEEETLDYIYTLVPGQVDQKSAFSFFWQLTFRFAAKRAKGRDAVKKEWTRIIRELGYNAILDKRGAGTLSRLRRPAILILEGVPDSDIEDLEIVSTQQHKRELNSRMIRKIAKFNELTKVSNARRRIAKW